MQQMVKTLQGLHTVSTVSKTLGITRRTAINYLTLLRKAGYVETTYQKGKIRWYKVSTLKKPQYQGVTLHEVINRYSKIKVTVPIKHVIHKELSVEEALVRAIAEGQKGMFRTVLASLGLFNKIKNWSRLLHYVHQYHVERAVGVLYEVTRKTMRARAMDQRIYRALLSAPVYKKFIVPTFKSNDFRDLQKKWKVYIPFTKADLEVYNE